MSRTSTVEREPVFATPLIHWPQHTRAQQPLITWRRWLRAMS